MPFLLSSTFADSLANLTREVQKAKKTALINLQVSIANPCLAFPNLDLAKEKQFWSMGKAGKSRPGIHKTYEPMRRYLGAPP